MVGRRSEDGFTLVELMVVVAIIGLAAGAVVLNLPPNGGSTRRIAEALAAAAAATRDQAIIAGRATTMRIDGAGYSFAIRSRSGETPIEGRRFAPGSWPAGVIVSGSRSLRFDPTGLAIPARVTVTRSGDDAGAIVAVAVDGRIDVVG